MNRDGVLARCRALAGSTEEFPFGPTAAVFKVGGKVFSIVDLEGRPGSVSLKCDPGYALALREEYAAVTPGYHLAKRHWNTIELDGSVPDQALVEWIQDSYDLIHASLTRAQRASLG
ncbi:MAG TPA: MmcQ/YjbR family DNA-binding protein [Chloroflexota bacterium]|jgi:predicted DNA-binding protein (MmcQ/YjbR family)|nr:MmcQ/YjbR family DNA-binding protein [Chloroflexota bacterium]